MQGLPADLKVNATGVLSDTQTKAGTYPLILNVVNGIGKGSAPLTLSVVAAPPTITSVGSTNATVGTAFSYQISASNSPTSFGAHGLPGGLAGNAFTSLTGRFDR